MSARLVSACPSVVRVSFSPARPTERAKATGVVDAFTVRSKVNACAMTGRPRLRSRIVERHDEVALRCGAETAFDDGPLFEVVGERDGAKVMAERRAKPRRRRLHCGHPWLDSNVELQPSRIFLDGLEHCRRHGEHAWIAAGNDGNCAARCRKIQCEAGAVHFNSIVARVSALVGPQCETLHIRAVADNIARCLNRRARFGRHPLGGAGPSPTIMTRPVTDVALSRARE